MRSEQVAEVVETFPAKVATFDEGGISTAVNQLASAGLLGKFIEVLKTDVATAQQVINVVWLVPGPIGLALNNLQKATQAFNTYIAPLPLNARPQQVVAAIVGFLKKVLS